MSRCLLIALILPLLESTALGQSLGEAAAREKDKRAKRGATATRSYTGDDLKTAPKPGSETDSASAGTAPILMSGDGTEEGSSTSEDAEGGASSSDSDERAWRQRMKEHRDAIAAAEQAIRASEERLARLMSDRDPVGLMDPNRLQTIESQKNEAMQALESAQRDLAGARQALQNLEEEARRNNIPPGWLR